jgi:hypothetical protein
MVRISLPNRLKSYTGQNSTSNSRSSSPSPGMKKSFTGGSDGSPESAKGNGLVLKVVVLRVGGTQPQIVNC